MYIFEEISFFQKLRHLCFQQPSIVNGMKTVEDVTEYNLID